MRRWQREIRGWKSLNHTEGTEVPRIFRRMRLQKMRLASLFHKLVMC